MNAWTVGDLVTWMGWHATVVGEASALLPNLLRLRIQSQSGNDFTVLALPGEVRTRSSASKLYTPLPSMAIYAEAV